MSLAALASGADNPTKVFTDTWANTATFASLGLTLIGFAITIYGVFRTKSAAEAASKSAAQTRTAIVYGDTVAELSAVTALMEEIKRLHRISAWAILPDRYSSLRQRLVRIHSSNIILSGDAKASLIAAGNQLARLEIQVDRAIASGTAPPKPAKLNQIVNAQMDVIDSILRELQRTTVT